MFSGSKGAVDFFGSNLYLVKSNSFELIKAPSVIIGKKTDTGALGAGDIVVFSVISERENVRKKAIGIITNIKSETFIDETGDEEVETVIKTFRIADESENVLYVDERDILSKAVQASRVFGIIINFAVSPAGLFVIAVIPCFGIVLSELMKPIFRKRQYEKEVPPVNKQEEVPTFVPVDTEKNNASAAVAKTSGKSAAALKAYKETLKITNTAEFTKTPELFITAAKKPADKSKPQKKKPLSSVKLAEAIAAVNSPQENDDSKVSLQELSAAEKARLISQAMAKTKIKEEE